jgi:hypothetical protein
MTHWRIGRASSSTASCLTRLEARALDLPEIKKWAADFGVVPAPATPEEFRKRVEGRYPAMARDRRAQ